MKRGHRTSLVLVVLLAVIGLAAWVFHGSGSADGSCRLMMVGVSGYGPWHPLPTNSQADTDAFITTRSYSDGMNTATCRARRLGPVWFTAQVSQTLIGFSCGLGARRTYPVKAYGVLPAEAESAEELRQAFSAFAKSVCADVRLAATPIPE